jgi:hypothetical protein
MTMLDPVEYVATIAVARRRDLLSCSTFLAAHESVVPFVRKDSASSHKPMAHRTPAAFADDVPIAPLRRRKTGRLTEHRPDQTSRLKSRSVTSFSGSQQSFVELIARRRAASACRSQAAARGRKRRWSISRFHDLLVARSNALIFRCSVGPGLSFADEPAFVRTHKRRSPGLVDRPP